MVDRRKIGSANEGHRISLADHIGLPYHLPCDSANPLKPVLVKGVEEGGGGGDLDLERW